MPTLTTSPPVFLLAFANDRDDRAKYLRNLPEELRQITEALDVAKSHGLCEYVYLANATLKQILDTFQKEEYRNRIAVFHYGGHANSFQLLLETNDGRVATTDADGLASFLGRQAGLELVFLNGCSTQRQVERLMAGNIPMVIATSQAIDDEVAMTFASRFYSGLAKGLNLNSAYLDAEVEARSQGDGTSRNLYSSQAQMALANMQEDRWPWDLYVKPGAEAARQWNLPDAVDNPLFGIPGLARGDLPAEPFRHLSWFTRQDVEIFFGRDNEIRQLYDRITEPMGAPIVLLYGQAGVGKSSLLDAGISPRLERTHQMIYLRRNDQLGLLGTVAQAFGLAKDDSSLLEAWRDRELQLDQPVVLILDQIEELFTRPGTDPEVELRDFLQALTETFAIPAERPQGRLVLGFRKEWESEIEQRLKEFKLSHAKVFIGPLNRRAIVQATAGISKSPRLRQHYGLVIEAGLPELIADDLAFDPNSPIAPTLQILLTKLWTEAKKRSNSQPTFDVELYRELQQKGILLGDFLDQQLSQLQTAQPEAVNSGLALDVLAYHTTALGTAEQRTQSEVEEEYRHQVKVLLQLSENLKGLYLLSDPPLDSSGAVTKATRLAHDTIGPLVRARFDQSVYPGQRARRILENRRVEWTDNKNGSPLDARDLASVEAGLAGMRATLPEEDRLITASRLARDRRELRTKVLRVAATIAVIAIVVSAGVAWWLYRKAEVARQQALSRQLAAQADSLGTGAAWMLTQRVLLGIEALRRFDSGDSSAALLEPLALLPRIRALRKSDHPIEIVRFSPDGKTLAIGEANTVQLWDVTTNTSIITFQDEQPIKIIRFSSDGRYVASGSGEVGTLRRSKKTNRAEYESSKGFIIVWDCLQRRQVAKREFPKPVREIGFLKDSPLITMADFTTANTFSMDGTKQDVSWPIFEPDNVRIIRTALTEDARFLAVGTNSLVRIYDVLSGHVLSSVQVDRGEDGKAVVWELAFSPDGSLLTTSTLDLAQVWDWKTARQISKMKADRAGDFTISADNKYVAAINFDNVFLWDAASGTSVGTPLAIGESRSDGSYSTQLMFSPDSASLAVASGDSTVRLFRLTTPEDSKTEVKESLRIVPGTDITHFTFSPHGRSLATADEEGQAAVWDVAGVLDSDITPDVVEIHYDPKGQYILRRTETHLSLSILNDDREVRFDGAVANVTISNDGARFAFVRLAAPVGESYVEVCEMATGRVLNETRVSYLITTLAFSQNGSRLLIAAKDEPLRELEIQSGALVKHDGLIGSYQSRLSRNAKYFATRPDVRLLRSEAVGKEWTVEVFEIASGKRIAALNSKSYDAQIAFSENSEYLATNVDDSTLVLWDLENGRELRRLETPETVEELNFSKDNRYLASAVGSNAIVWDLRTGERIVLNHDSGYLRTMSFSNDSNSILTTHAPEFLEESDLVEIWSLPHGERIRAFKLDGKVSEALFSPNDERLVLVGEWLDKEEKKHSRLVPWRAPELIAEACKRVGRNFTLQEWKQYLGSEPYRKTCPNIP